MGGNELEKDERIAKCYELWYDQWAEICRIYDENIPERVPLSQQKEFKTIRNMVIREVLKFSAQPEPEKTQNHGESMEQDCGQSYEQDSDTPHEDPETQTTPTGHYQQDRKTDLDPAAVATGVLRIFTQAARIFRERMEDDTAYISQKIDRKRWKELQRKRKAMGHRMDDHEEQVQY